MSYPTGMRRRSDAVPPLPAESHVCRSCGLSYAEVSAEDAATEIWSVPSAVREAVAAIPVEIRRRRPSDGVWSVAEYVCHLRDVYATYTIRLHRARTEHRPVLEPMLNDLRARRFRYNDRDLDAVLDELGATVGGFCDEVARTGPDQWERVVTRLPGEVRTARWLLRQAMHEGRHHLADIRKIGETLRLDQ